MVERQFEVEVEGQVLSVTVLGGDDGTPAASEEEVRELFKQLEQSLRDGEEQAALELKRVINAKTHTCVVPERGGAQVLGRSD